MTEFGAGKQQYLSCNFRCSGASSGSPYFTFFNCWLIAIHIHCIGIGGGDQSANRCVWDGVDLPPAAPAFDADVPPAALPLALRHTVGAPGLLQGE